MQLKRDLNIKFHSLNIYRIAVLDNSIAFIYNKIMKKTTEELNNELIYRINYLEKLVKDALAEEIGSEMRRQIILSISVILRAVCINNSRNECLIAKCGIKDEILFPLIDGVSPLNILADFKLINYSVNNQFISLEVKKDLLNLNLVPKTIISFDSWLHEVVIDLKDSSQKCQFLSRYEIIHILADKDGAHVDSDVDDKYLNLMSSEFKVMQIIINDQVVNYDFHNLLLESLLGIAIELIYSFKFPRKKSIKDYWASKGKDWYLL